MNVTRVTRVANPRRAKAKRRNPKRKLSPKQIAIFGTKRQKAALRAARARKRNAAVKAKAVAVKRRAANGRKQRSSARKRNGLRSAVRRVVKRAKRAVRRKSRKRNPAPLVLTLGAVNPAKRRKVKMAKRRKKTAVRARRRNRSGARRRRSNPTTVVRKVYVKRRNSRRRKSSGRKRNPSVFGVSRPLDLTKMAGGVLIGVAAAKLIPPMIPSSTLTSSLPAKVIVTGVVAIGAGMLATKFAGPQVGSAVTLGGLAQTASMALNAVVPAVGSRLSLGDFVPASYPLPNNTVMAGQARPALVAAGGKQSAAVNIGAFGKAFGR